MNVHFGDSLHLMKDLIKDKHKALELEKGGFCKPNQGSLYTHLFNKQFDAHDALEDVRALRRFIFDSSLNLSGKTPLSLPFHKQLKTCSTLIDAMNFSKHSGTNCLMKAIQLLNPWLRTSLEVVSYNDLRKLYATFRERGIVAILSNPPSTSSSKTPRVSVIDLQP